MRAKTCLYGHIKRPARTTKIYPMRVTGKTGRPSIRRQYCSASSSPAQCYLFAGNHPTVDAFEDQIKISHTMACSMRAASEPTDRSGARRLDSCFGVLHEDLKRADRSLGGLGTWNLKRVRPMRATSEPTVRSGAQHQGIATGY